MELLDTLYQTMMSHPLYIGIAVIFAICVVWSVVKKLFKMFIVIVALIIVYLLYLHFTGQALPKNAEELIDNVKSQTESVIEKAEELKENWGE